MADTAVKIGDISSQLTKASRLVLSTDGFWIQTGGDSQGNGQSVLIPAEFVRAYLTNGISPSIGEDGNWYINGKNLGVKAEGVTPQLRGGTLGIEVSYDKGQPWKTAVLYSDMDIDLDELEKQYKTAIDKANTATKNANDATALAHTATTAANNASSDAQTAESQRADAEKQRAAAEQQRAATFQKLADGNAATITEMQRIASSISNAQGAVRMSSVPASICVETDFTAVAGGTVNVSPTFFVPRGCNGSVMYHVISGNATAHLNGEVNLPSETGDVCVEVIPALNNMAGKVVSIHVTAPTPLLDLSGEEITDERGEAITA